METRNVILDDQAAGARNQLSAREAMLEMDDSALSRSPSRHDHNSSHVETLAGVARHTLGLILLLIVVFLWTLSNFLGSSIFADNTYAKPFFLTYLNTSALMLVMFPPFIRTAFQRHQDGTLRTTFSHLLSRRHFRKLHSEGVDESSASESESFLHHHISPTLQSTTLPPHAPHRQRTHLALKPTAKLSLTFCLLWFSANYFAMASLQHTTVASTTILTSTSSIWTLLIGACTHIEIFTIRKLLGVLASLVGIILISRVDLTSSPSIKPPPAPSQLNGRDPINPFPSKPPSELLMGDTIALLSAVIYGAYTIMLKKSTLSALPLQLNMPLFFGLVGLFNFLFLWPLFPLLHYTSVELFELPPTRHIWNILLINAVSSLLSDVCWAYAMLFTSPLVVTVGLSLTIPLSLLGEMIIQGRTEGLVYWVGAGVVVCSFVFVDREEVMEEDQGGRLVPRIEVEPPTPGGVGDNRDGELPL